MTLTDRTPRDPRTTAAIQGRELTFPIEVRDAAGCITAYVVRSSVADRLVGDAFTVVDFLPGRTLLMLGCIDYRDNDLGDYNEVALNFFVRHGDDDAGLPFVGAWKAMASGTLPSYSWKMPVDQSFTRDAGAEIWGFPKTVEHIPFSYDVDGRFRGRLEMDGELVFEIDAPRGGDRARPPSDAVGYSYLDGVPHRTAFTQQSKDMGIGRGGDVGLVLGDHPIARELRALGLPKRPLMTTWIGHMAMSFEPPERLI